MKVGVRGYRTIARRFGLEPDPTQSRCIGTSASLPESSDSSFQYLEQFFGVDRATFTVIPGTPRELKATQPLSRQAFKEIDVLPLPQHDEGQLARPLTHTTGLQGRYSLVRKSNGRGSSIRRSEARLRYIGQRRDRCRGTSNGTSGRR